MGKGADSLPCPYPQAAGLLAPAGGAAVSGGDRYRESDAAGRMRGAQSTDNGPVSFRSVAALEPVDLTSPRRLPEEAPGAAGCLAGRRRWETEARVWRGGEAVVRWAARRDATAGREGRRGRAGGQGRNATTASEPRIPIDCLFGCPTWARPIIGLQERHVGPRPRPNHGRDVDKACKAQTLGYKSHSRRLNPEDPIASSSRYLNTASNPFHFFALVFERLRLVILDSIQKILMIRISCIYNIACLL